MSLLRHGGRKSAAVSTVRIGMGDVRRQDDGVVLIGDGGQPGSPGRSLAWARCFSVCSGALGTVTGAAASLVVPAVARVAVWCGVAVPFASAPAEAFRPGSAWRRLFALACCTSSS